MRNIIITGGGMTNKGAQAMTFIAVNELTKRFPDHRILLYSPNDLRQKNFDQSIFRFDIFGWYPIKFARCQKNPFLRLICKLRNGKELSEAEAIYKNCDMMIDISGYAIGSNWSKKVCTDFLDSLEFANCFDIPFYLMPQSFGPFDFEDAYTEIDARCRKLLPAAKVIFAREQEGYDALVRTYDLKNVRRATDLVLANKEIDLKNVFRVLPSLHVPEVVAGSVAVIPSQRNTVVGGKEGIVSLYSKVIEHLLSIGKSVYLLSHSAMDADLCKTLKEAFPDDDRVTWFEQDFSCLEFNELVRRFDYLVASRFHSIVHAFKNAVPCVALGWATKYHDLLNLFEQGSYIFDVRTPDPIGLLQAIDRMNRNFSDESEKIRSALSAVQNENVFDVLSPITKEA